MGPPAKETPSSASLFDKAMIDMPGRKEKFADKAFAVVHQGDAPLRASKLPRPIQFPLIVTLSLSSSALLYSFAAEYTAGELATISRSLNGWWEVGALVAWRTIELGVGWFGNYDGYDLAALSLLSHGPPLYLLTTFYNISPSTILSSLVIDTLTTYVPFRLLRPLSVAHASSTSSSSVEVPNREIVTDFPIQTLITILVAGIYSVSLSIAYAWYLPVAFVTYFNNIPTIEAAHNSTPITLLPFTLILGLAARSFIFTPAAASPPPINDSKAAPFNPATATLLETLEQNLWSYSSRTKIVIKRTATLVLVSGVNTFVQVWVTIEGVEAPGAAAYASVWAAAALVVGVSLGLVGNV